MRVRIVGAGRAGGSFATALRGAGWEVDGPIGRDAAAIAAAASGVDLVLICVADPAIEGVAAAIEPNTACVVAHCAGSLGLDVLGAHERRAAVHPLVSLPTPELGAARLSEAWFAVAGDPVAGELVAALGGRSFVIDDEHRAAYHAAACIAANHLVALLGQVERVGNVAGAPFEAYLALARGALDNVATLGPAAALTGPAARGDEATIARHLAAIDPSERSAYEALADQARRLAASGV
ncbi:MAG: DUF2520 domain-containing protein [Acidimicrobiales bacterium]